MPDDNSCLFRAFGTAVLPGDDHSMPELRSIVASRIQADPLTYSKVVLEQEPDDYCRWIQTSDAWGGGIEMGILAEHFNIEICSIDVKSLRVDKFGEGQPNRCFLVYSGIHYDLIVLSPSYTGTFKLPEFDERVFNVDDDEMLAKAVELCRMLQDIGYFTDTGGMKIRCEVPGCGVISYGQGQASQHAERTGHLDMTEIK
jgi:ubiquitin thioesterase OTU1